ncbi:hypothetical protein MTYP_03195 [Methylophilaceae bacterium]|nr:hypothetical protein MTYP_03195 [Methylophilaceae bacterium]
MNAIWASINKGASLFRKIFLVAQMLGLDDEVRLPFSLVLNLPADVREFLMKNDISQRSYKFVLL